MSTTTTNYGLIKPDITDPILIGQLNDNADTIDATMKSISDALDVAKLGIKYKGEVNYYADLPNSAEIGDAYTVKYAGSSGTTPDGTEYVWGTVSGTNQWINFSKDSYTKAEVDALLALKQNALTTAQLAAVNSGIDSEKVAQIETNKNNILSLEAANGAKNELDCNVSTLTPLNMGGVWSGNTYSINSGTTKFAINSDLTLTVSKSDTGTIRALILYNYIDGSILNGKVISGGSSNVPIIVQKNGGNYQTYAETTGDGVLIKGIPSGQATRIVISLSSDIICSNIVVKPMLCEKPLYDISSSYQPHALSNVELTAAIQAIQAQLANQ